MTSTEKLHYLFAIASFAFAYMAIDALHPAAIATVQYWARPMMSVLWWLLTLSLAGVVICLFPVLRRIAGMLPEGVPPFKGKVNEELVVTLKSEGVYGIKCTPHLGMGMVMLVVAGAPTNLEAAKAIKHPGKARAVFDDLFETMAAR